MDPLPENWWEVESVQSILSSILAEPTAPSPSAAVAIPGGVLRNAHVHGLVRALDRFVGARKPFPGVSRVAALHAWLYHLGGGSDAKLLPPIAKTTHAGAERSKEIETAATKASVKFFERRAKLKLKISRGDLAASDELDGLRLLPYDFSKLRGEKNLLQDPEAASHRTATGGRRVVPPGGGDPAPGSDADQQRHTDALRAFAMGTHERLGAGYASRDEPCAVRRLSNDHDVLGLIADYVRGRPRRALEPPPREVQVLRAGMWHEHREKQGWRELAEERGVQLEAALADATRAMRREAQAHAEAAALREQFDEFRRDLQADSAEWRAAVERASEAALKEKQRVAAAALRAQKRESTVLFGAERERAERAEAEVVRAKEDKEGDRRADLARYRQREREHDAARAQAARSLAELEHEYTAQLAAMERLRNARNGSALQRQAALEEEVKRLKQRRTLNQRRQSDANLAIRRAEVAQQQTAAARAALGEYGVSMEAERAATKLADQLEKQVAELQAQLKAATEEAAQFKAIAEPPRSKFYNNGFTPEVDLCACEVMLLGGGVARNQVPELFTIFGNFYGVKIPLRKEEMKVPARMVDGKMTYTTKPVPCTPSKTHCKRLLPVLNQLHKLQVGKELLRGGLNAHFCYGADGAESLQRDFVLHQLTRRVDGKLHTMSVDLQQLHSKTSEAQADGFIESLRQIAELCKRAGVTEDVSPLITNPNVTSSINDRAAAARKAARLVVAKLLGVDVETIPDGPSCAEHAWVNILEEGRKAIDGVLRQMMNISEDQADADAKKVKAMRTAVGWFSSPACATIYQVCKYVAAFSSKGYAIGEKFAQWLAAELHVKEETLEGELLGHVQDLIAICGSRSYVFFMNAAVVERLCNSGSLLTFLEEEADLGSESGGKLRSAILTGFNSPEIMAAVRAMALICDSCLFTGLRSIKPEDTAHILDVLPSFWPKVLGFFEEAAQSPATVVSGELCLLPAETARQRKETPRAARAEIDMQRIRAAAKGDPLLERMLSAAFTAMAAGTRNHASEFLPGGRLCSEKVTPELRKAFDGCQTTSTSVERGFAIGRLHDRQAGVARADSRAGWVLGKMDGTVADIRSEPIKQQVAFLRLAKKCARETYAEGKLSAVKLAAGLSKREERTAKLNSKRAKKIAKEKERARIAAVTLVERYTGLVDLRNDQLADQLKAWKLKLGKGSGFAVSYPNRKAFVLQLQTIMAVQIGSAANDLPPGESGIQGRGLKVRRTEKGQKGAPKKRKAGVQYYGDYEWDEDENEEGWKIEAIVDKVKADGVRVFANQGKVRKGRVMYRIIWDGYPADLEWWEPASQIEPGFLRQYETGLAEQAAAEAADEAEDAELEESDDESDGDVED